MCPVETWDRVNSVDWVHLAGDEGADVVAGVMIGWGYADQPVRSPGLAHVVAASLHAALAQPDARPVGVSVQAFDTAIQLRGDVVQVQDGLERLDSILADPQRWITVPPNWSSNHPYRGWAPELAAWTGPTRLTLGALVPWQSPGSDTEVMRAIAGLHPGTGRRIMAYTSDESLIGCAFSGEPLDATSPPRLDHRAAGPASVHTRSQANLMSVVTPDTPAPAAAMQCISARLQHQLQNRHGGHPGIATMECVAGDTRLSLLKVDRDERFDAQTVRAEFAQIISNPAAMSDEWLDFVIGRLQSPDLLTGKLQAGYLARQALLTGARLRVNDIVAEADGLTTRDVRAALEEISATALISIDPTGPAPDGYPLRTAPDIPRKARHRIYQSWVLVPDTAGDKARYVTTRRGDALIVQRKATKARPAETRQVDLSTLVARIDYGDDASSLIDAELRTVVVYWHNTLRGDRLRKQIDSLSDPEHTIVHDPVGEMADVTSRAKGRRRNLSIWTGVALAVAALLFFFQLTSQSSTQDDVAMDETVTLGNGTTLRISDPTWIEAGPLGGPTLQVSVHACGGGPTQNTSTGSSDGRNYIAPSRFSLPGRDPIVRSPPEDYLLTGTLNDGECVNGAVVFNHPSGEVPDVTVVEYSNLLDDRITWTEP